MNKLVSLGVGAAAVVAVLVIGSQVLRPAAAVDVGGSPSVPPSAPPSATTPPDPPSGTVRFMSDGSEAVTVVDASFDGGSVSGTAVTTFATGTHTVTLECAARDGDTWAVAGTTEQTTVSGERPGDWSAVIVRDGSPQQIAIWLSDGKAPGTDCAGWLAAMDMSTIDAVNFAPVQSGVLEPPPDPPSGTVRFMSDGAAAMTEVDALFDGGSVSGTAVTTFATGTHTVTLECADRDGDTWAIAGTTEQTTVSGERPGDWSAVIVKDGSPQRIGIWLSDPKVAGIDCAGWLAAIDFSTIDDGNFTPVLSGVLEPPPVAAP